MLPFSSIRNGEFDDERLNNILIDSSYSSIILIRERVSVCIPGERLEVASMEKL